MQHEPTPTASAKAEAAGLRLSALSSLLEDLDEARGAATTRNASIVAHENQLAQVRLGTAASLFAALRAKHAPTASHSLRVALACSSWSLKMDITDDQRDEIEVAAILHDVGKIGVPDMILQKPGKLTADEVAVMERHREIGGDILLGCSAEESLLNTIRLAGAWFDGSRASFPVHGEELPLGARMLSIVDAFDSMTTDHVYRRAMARERAMAELFECAGTQFDPHLVKDFCELLTTDEVRFTTGVARRWLEELHPTPSDAMWSLGQLKPPTNESIAQQFFQQHLVNSMHDGVVFVGPSLRIVLWNQGAERLTGIPASSVVQKQWLPSLLAMSDQDDEVIPDDRCPIAHAIRSGVQTTRRLAIVSRDGERLAVDVHIVPVVHVDGVCHGATVLLHDASSQITLEERVETLHVKATQDPLTKIANRAEFDRVHDQFVHEHLQRAVPCSLIICDLDFFKRINDTYGHQAGDEALVGFAALLRRFHRPGDLVARYGGEEFVLLCKDCDNATATARAEEIRRELEQMPQQALSSKCITASFGVTEIQAGDTAETMLRRADRALLQAKDLGRNTVVQLGAGISGSKEELKSGRSMLTWLRSTPPDQLFEQELITPVPINIVVEKLRGFVADHHAEITSIKENHVALKIDGRYHDILRRQSDRAVPFIVVLEFDETRLDSDGEGRGGSLRTLVKVSIRPIRNRDRRRRDIVQRARQLVASLRSYLMAQDYSVQSTTGSTGKSDGVMDKARRILLSPFSKKHLEDGRY